MARSTLVMIGAIVLAVIMLGSAVAAASTPAVTSNVSQPTAATESIATQPLSAVSAAAPAASSFGTNSKLAETVASDEKSFLASGRNPSSIHPPNLHQAPPLKSTGGSVTPLYSIAP